MPQSTKGPKGQKSKPNKSFKITKSAPQKRKTGTVTTKKHRFESFSARISKINIDPIRRVQGRSYVHQQDDASHFKVAFDEWRELNLTESFTSFARQVDRLCHNLPQILHYQDRIMELLVQHINKHESVSLEPLLALVAHFAHDLGTKFEKHFQLAVATVSQLAAKHSDVAVMEWSFTCLAWLFKYLARLLVPDLRPVYGLMAPLLGREHQKGFVMRFAAEAMSFLVRKAAAAYPKNKAPLDNIIEHAFSDLASTVPEQRSQYQEGLIILFAEAIKGVQRGVNTYATHIVEALLHHLLNRSEAGAADNILLKTVRSILIEVIHSCDEAGFQPVVETILKRLPTNISDPAVLLSASSILFLISGTRKGTRIGDWNSLIAKATVWLQAVDEHVAIQSIDGMIELLKAVASILQYASFDVILPFSQQVLRKLNSQHWDPHFLGFCIFVADVDAERFESLLLPGLQKFIASRWEMYEEQICFLLPRFAGLSSTIPTKVRLPSQGQSNILATFQRLGHQQSSVGHSSGAAIAMCNRYIDVLGSLHSDPNFLQQLAELLYELLARSRTGSVGGDLKSAFLFSKGLSFLVMHFDEKRLDTDFLRNLMLASGVHGNRVEYLRSLLTAFQRGEIRPRLEWSESEKMMEVLIENLASPSHELRLTSLEILEMLYKDSTNANKESLESALSVERSSFDLEAMRFISLHVRKLASLYVDSVHEDKYLATALPAYCYGLLSVRLTSVWDDASIALQTMSKAEGKEDVIVKRALAWLEPVDDALTDSEDLPEHAHDTHNVQASKSYQCSNIMLLEQFADNDLTAASASREHILKALRAAIAPIPTRSLLDRAQALRVLTKVSHIAERKSRTLVPVLLQWALGDEIGDSRDTHEDVADEETHISTERWNRKDQKALLHLFSLFVNPTVLYRSAEVYQALLGLLCNGDVEIQKSALKAIFAWKSPSIRPYEENLMNILDDARFRDEIAVFLSISEEDSKIRVEHRTDLMPVLLRMLYGRIVTRTGIGNRGTQQSKRRAVLLALARFGESDLSDFMHIALGTLDKLDLVNDESVSEEILGKDIVPIRKQLGMLNMLDDTLDTLGELASPFAGRLICAIMYCAIRASRRLQQSSTEAELEGASMLRSVRQSGYNCLVSLFTACPKSDWRPYSAVVVKEIINPRLDKLAVETAQSVSAILKLVATWSSNDLTATFLVETNLQLLGSVSDAMVVPSAKEEVKVYLLNNILKNVLEQALKQESGNKIDTCLKSGLANVLLDRVASMLDSNTDKSSLDAGIRVLSSLTPYANSTSDAPKLIQTCLRLLTMPARIVNPRLKGETLAMLDHYIPLHDFTHNDTDFDKAVRVISTLFSYFQDTQNRLRLSAVFRKLCVVDVDLEVVAALCDDLNAFSSARLDEPDFEKRLGAFTVINDEKFDTFSARQWHPLVHNMLYHVKDNQELSIRTSASLTLRKFVQKTCSDTAVQPDQVALLTDAVLPALQTGMKEESELIRTEYVAILAEVVKTGWPSVQDMKPLLGADDESSIFNNILHIQQHRRVRALRRIAESAASVSSTNVARFCIPLIENFYNGGEDLDANLAGEAVNTLGALSESLDWQKYRAFLQRMIGEASKFDTKIKIKAMGAAVNALFNAAQSKKIADTTVDGADADTQIASTLSQLARTLPQEDALYNSLAKSVLAKLTEQIHFKDESTVDLRILVSMSAVRVIMCFSPDAIDLLLPSLLLDICNILKSRSQEARDTTRKTLAEISAIIGTRYFGFLIKQLGSALKSGPQKHVLSYTVHSILVAIAPNIAVGDIDYCLPDIMDIIMEDLFGFVAQEKEAQEYLSKMREVKKKSLGYDSMELLASMIQLNHVTDLLQPIQDQLRRPRPKFEKIDELLRRLREGLRASKTAKSQDLLTLCYEILQSAYKNVTANQNTDPSSYKMAAFALELLRRVLDKYEDLKTPGNLAGFLPLLRQSMAQGVEEVEIASMRLFTSIIKIPLPEIDANAKLYLRLAKRLIESASSTSTPVSQAALRLVSAVLRERPNADIPKYDWDNSLAFILDRIKPDLQEPAKQGDRDVQVAAFNFLRAVINRKEPIAEIYGVMDVVREVMITSSEPPIPDLARSVYTRFVLEYFPDELKGFAKQLEFLVANLQYTNPRGRLSVMEVIMFVLDHKGDAAVQPMLVTFFLPLILALATDDNEQCRGSAALLLHKIFERADKERTKTFRAQMSKWLDSEMDVLWRCVGFQCWAIYFDVHSTATKEATTAYRSAADVVATISADDLENGSLLHRALELVAKLCTTEALSAISFGADTMETWSLIPAHLSHPTKDVRITSARLISLYLASFARAASVRKETLSLPIAGPNGLELTEDELSNIIEPSMQLLMSEKDTDITSQTVQNLAFIGRIAAASSSEQAGTNAAEQSDEEDDDDDEDTGVKQRSLLLQLIARTSKLLRVETTPLPTKLSAMTLLTSLVKSATSPAQLQPVLHRILLPLHNLTDAIVPHALPSTITPSTTDAVSPQDALIAGAHDLLAHLQSVLGSTEFVAARQKVQKQVNARREGRRLKRAIDKVSVPERYEEEKRRKRIGAKEKRREKGKEMAGRRRGW